MKAVIGLKKARSYVVNYCIISTLLCSALSLPHKLCAQSQSDAKLSILLLLDSSGSKRSVADGAVAVFGDRFSSGIGFEDTHKFVNTNENLAIMCQGKLLSIEGRPVAATGDSLCLSLWKYRYKKYFLKFEATNFPVGLEAKLYDNYLHTFTNLNLAGATTLSFDLNDDTASYAANRFAVVFGRQSNLLPVKIANFAAAQTSQGVQIVWTVHEESNIDYYELQRSGNGQDFTTISVTKASETISNVKKYSYTDFIWGLNYYRLKIIERSGEIQYGRVISYNGIAQMSFRVYPNPLQGRELHISAKASTPGSYDLVLYNQNAQKVFATQVRIANNDITIHLPVSITSGSYILTLSGQNMYKNCKVIVHP